MPGWLEHVHMSKLVALCALHAFIVRPLNLNKAIKKCSVIKRDVPCTPVVAEMGAQPTPKVDGMGQGVSGKSGGVRAWHAQDTHAVHCGMDWSSRRGLGQRWAAAEASTWAAAEASSRTAPAAPSHPV